MARLFWFVCFGSILGTLLALSCIGLHLCRRYRSKVLKQVWEAYGILPPVLQKVGWRDYFESNLRAETGKTLERPFGTTVHFFSWQKIQFNPVYFSRSLTGFEQDSEINTEVTLGLNARKPAHLKIPVMIAGMSYGGALSLRAKTALAKAATLAGTASNSGNGPFLQEERSNSDKYILQFSRGFWAKEEQILKQADIIEINLGQGAWGPAPVRLKGSLINDEFASRLGAFPGLDVLIESRLPEVEDINDWKRLIGTLKEVTGGVPVAVKLGGTHYIERELDFICAGDVDIVVIDGTEGGTHACPSILLDDVGLPTFPLLCRTVHYLQEKHLTGRVSLVCGGGMVTPGDFMKCLALGANAVIIGTAVALAMVHTQVSQVIPWEPPTSLIYHKGKEEKRFNPDLSAKHVNYFFQSCVKEMKQVSHALGKKNLREINREDLVALEPLYAEIAGIKYLKNEQA